MHFKLTGQLVILGKMIVSVTDGINTVPVLFCVILYIKNTQVVPCIYGHARMLII